MRHETQRRLSAIRNLRFFSSAGTATAMMLSLGFAAVGVIVAFAPADLLDQKWTTSINAALLFLTIFALIAAIYLEFRRAVDYVIDATHGGFENRFIMASHDSFEELDNRIKRAVSIKNTFIDHRNAMAGGTSNPYAFYAHNRIQAYRDFYATGGKAWVDIVSKNTVLSNARKFSKARDQISMAARGQPIPDVESTDAPGEGDESDTATRPEGPNTQYQTYVLTQAQSSVNFVIFEYPDEDREVLWGWGFHDQEPSAPVFAAKDDRVVSYFSNLFESLRRDSAENIEDTSKNAFYERRWIGAWVERGLQDQKDGQGQKSSWAVRLIVFDQFSLLMYCYVLGDKGEKIRSYETRTLNIDRGVLSFNSDSQDRRTEMTSAASRRGFGRLKLDIPNDRPNYSSNEFREYRGVATILGTNDGQEQEDFEIMGHRVHIDMLEQIPGITAELDVSERYDLGRNPEPIYLSHMLGALSKLSKEKRLAWLKQAFAYQAPDDEFSEASD